VSGGPKDISRREFVALSLAAGLGGAARTAAGADLRVIERSVAFKTPDGMCDAAFFHPDHGSYPGVLIWPDSLGLRPALRELGNRLAGEGYSVLVPNHLYRTAKAPVFREKFDPLDDLADNEEYRRHLAPFLAPGATDRDAVAYVEFLDAQTEVSKTKKIGTHGYCLGGPYVLKTAAAFPGRIGAGASLHGAFLATDKPDSAHLLAPKIKARLYFAIASDDDAREPAVKDKLIQAFTAGKVQAEIEVFPNARHGWCVPDNKPAADNRRDAERAWRKLVALYREAL
jgi:carboxymethylenebutenolidase